MGKPVFFGLDISDRSIDLVSLIRKEGKIVVDRYGRADLPPGAIDRGVIEDVTMVSRIVADLLRSLYGEDKPRKFHAGIALPETQIFSKIFRLPPNLPSEMALQAAEQEAKDVFPIDLRHALKETVVVHRDKDGQDVYFAAIVGRVLQGYIDVARQAGIEPSFFDSEAVSVVRALVRTDDPPTLIVDIGARSTMLSVAEEGGVRMTSDIAIAGNSLTTAIETKLEVPMAEAEQLKRVNGFDPNAKDDRIFFLLQAPMREIIKEMRQVLDYYRRKTGRTIPKVLLTGGGSLVPFLAEYVASNLPGVTTTRADPLEKLHIDDSSVDDAFHRNATMHAAAIGLALRVIGVTTHPQLTFVTEQPKGFHFSQLFKGLGERFTSMAPRAKKTSSVKKHSPKSEEHLSVPPPVTAVVPPPVSAPAPDDSVLAQLSPAIEAQKEVEEEAAAAAAAAAAPAPVAAPAILTNIMPPTNDQLYAEQRSGQHRNATGDVDEGDLYHDTPGSSGHGGRRSRAGVLALVVLVLILGVAAIAGVTMFLKKNDMMGSIVAMLPWKQKPASTIVVPAAPAAPDSVAVTFRLHAGETAVAGAAPAAADAEPSLSGRLLETDVSVKLPLTATGTKASVGGKARGTLTIVNKTSKPYSFVATTRFLSKSGILFRLDKATPIPANGSVKAAVTADKAGPEGDIAATTFTIPGLGAGFESTVYATSDTAMAGGAGGEVSAVSVDDLVSAKDALRDKAIKEAMADFEALRKPTEHLDDALLIDKEASFEAPEAGTAGSTFESALFLNVKTLTVPEDEVQKLLADAMSKVLPAGASTADYALGSLAYHVVAFDVNTLEAEIRVEAPVKAAE